MTAEMSGKGAKTGLHWAEHMSICSQIPVAVNLHLLFNLTELIYRRRNGERRNWSRCIFNPRHWVWDFFWQQTALTGVLHTERFGCLTLEPCCWEAGSEVLALNQSAKDHSPLRISCVKSVTEFGICTSSPPRVVGIINMPRNHPAILLLNIKSNL